MYFIICLKDGSTSFAVKKKNLVDFLKNCRDKYSIDVPSCIQCFCNTRISVQKTKTRGYLIMMNVIV